MNLSEYSGKEILEKLNSGELSVLKELGAYDLKQNMAFVGLLGEIAAAIICMEKDDSKLRERAISVMKPFAPFKISGEFPQYNGSIIIGFNHPSLGEIFRLLCLGFKVYPDRKFLFPVNIPWYECLVNIIPKLARMGVEIVPMITPSTEAKLNKKFEGDNQKLDLVKNLKFVFARNYMRAVTDFANNNGIIVVAPSATRQATVLSEHIHPTMTLLSHLIFKEGISNVLFLPVAIIEPGKNDRKLNIFKCYGIKPCKPFYSEEVQSLNEKTKEFDYLFLKRIDKIYGRVKTIRKNNLMLLKSRRTKLFY